jgi:uroporphyrin-III C-methyltransferase/precorrin-2 dehydrogenase/sirohydrochlorin ferrochelatase
MRGSVDEAVSDAQRMLSQQRAGGEIVLVGAGPGDPDLITLRGLRAIQSADVLMYDKLIDPGLLEYARRDVELVDVGKQGPREDAGAKGWGSAAQQAGSKRPSGTHMQAAINERLIEEALRGKKVVRLKGGDPFIFGRGGEELLAAAQQGFAVEIIPGITAGMAAASYAGIPLTHRHVSQSVRFLTGHRVADAQNLEWSDWARDDQTLVIYMALVSLETIQERLLAAGRSAATPAVLIENATLPSQREVFASLAGLNQSVIKANITGPSIIIVGQAVEIAQQARQLLMQHDVEESTRAN